MTAIFETGGKQYRVSEGDTLYVEKLPDEAGSEASFKTVLALIDGDSVETGSPYVNNALVTAQVVKSARAKKVIVYKMKPKKNYRRKQGHRQPYTQLKITGVERIVMKGGKKKSSAKESEG